MKDLINQLMPYIATAAIAALNLLIIFLKTRSNHLIKSINKNDKQKIQRNKVEDPNGYYNLPNEEVIIIDENGEEHNLNSVKIERRKKWKILHV